MSNIKDLTGKTFGRLTVIALNGFTPNRSSIWLCRCSCGKFKFKVGGQLTGGNRVKSCGCLHAEAVKKKKYVGSGTRLYRLWNGMKGRCADKNNSKYGGRGITLCGEWAHDFESFRDWAMDNGYRDDLSIDRIDNNKGYSPRNCRLATTVMQANNRRTSRFLMFLGEKKTVAQLSREYRIPYDKLFQRIFRHGWTVEKALNGYAKGRK